VNIKFGHREIKNQEQLEEFIPYEVVTFCIAWKQRLDRLVDKDVRLDIYRKTYGYDVRYGLQENSVKWFFHLELYYPNSDFQQRISYLKINRFITLPSREGRGGQAFKELLECCHHFKQLEMIRLRAIRSATGFWKKQGFREQSDQIPWIYGDSLAYDLNCLKRPAVLTKCPYIYDLKKCNCLSCTTFHKNFHMKGESIK